MAYPGFMTAAILGVTIVTFFYFMFKERAQQQQQYENSYPSNGSYYSNSRRLDHSQQRRSRHSSIGSDWSTESGECPICLDTRNGQLAVLEPCGHIFHQSCIRKWNNIGSATSQHCPICRNRIISRP